MLHFGTEKYVARVAISVASINVSTNASEFLNALHAVLTASRREI